MYDKMFKSDNEKLSKLLDQVKSHEIQLPDFQRGWVWEDSRIRALLASLTKGFPIGAIMLLEAGGDYKFKCKNIEGSGDEKREPDLMILDGQQRMTSTFLAMRSKNPVNTMTDQNKPIKRYYYLNMKTALDPDVDRYDSIIAVDENKQIKENIGRDIVLDLSTREKEFENKMIPFNMPLKKSFLSSRPIPIKKNPPYIIRYQYGTLSLYTDNIIHKSNNKTHQKKGCRILFDPSVVFHSRTI